MFVRVWRGEAHPGQQIAPERPLRRPHITDKALQKPEKLFPPPEEVGGVKGRACCLGQHSTRAKIAGAHDIVGRARHSLLILESLTGERMFCTNLVPGENISCDRVVFVGRKRTRTADGRSRWRAAIQNASKKRRQQ